MTVKETFNSLKKELLSINESLSSVLSSVVDQADSADVRFENWRTACTDIHKQIAEDIVRVAVIGTVKSGKSTFVNSLFRGDYLKRGAGVVTSIVTRVRTGDDHIAVLYFKSWDEINTDIEQALVMLPTWESQGDDKHFDIRREKDRQHLRWALDGLSEDLFITDGTRNSGTVLLSLYLAGYEHISEMISADSATSEFSGDRFAEHQDYVGEDSMAVFLKDVGLVIKDDNLDSSIEIADCQGSDSPNPMHLAMIQDYLLRTHFIIYVVSSRTGLREADIRFLSMIKKMGILDNILFVLNIDFNEHDSLEDLNKLAGKFRDELSLLRPEPEIYMLSGLFNLFRAQSVTLSKKDGLRLKQWKAEKDFASLSNSETKKLKSALNDQLTKKRAGLLLKNHLERMAVMGTGLDRWVTMNRELLEKDVDGVAATIKKMKSRQERMKQIQTLVSSTFGGAKNDILKKLKSDITRFFNAHSGSVMEQTSSFVSQYNLPVEKYREKVEVSGFSNTLYLVFQEFKQALDSFMTETINPEIARFAGDLDKMIKTSLESVAGPFQDMASEEIAELKASVNRTSAAAKNSSTEEGLLNMNSLKQITGISLPSSTTAIQYTAKVKTEAMMRLGLYSTVTLVKKVFKKPPKEENEEQVHALTDGFNLIKRETEGAIVFHFENLRENIKFQYASKLLDASAAQLNQILMERFQSYEANINDLEKVAQKKGDEREAMMSFLRDVSREVQHIRDSITKCRGALDFHG